MTSAPKDDVKRIKSAISGLKRARKFVPWNESDELADKLVELLDDLKSAIDDPKTGVELLVQFYKTDEASIERCDDSNGTVGDVYQCDAAELFASYAARLENKQWLADLLFELIRDDEYSVRQALIDCAADYLPEPVLRMMVERFENAAVGNGVDYVKRHWLGLVESIARQLKDAPLFEKSRLACSKPVPIDCFDIARAYYDADDAKSALAWMERIPAGEIHGMAQRDAFMRDLYGKLGEQEKQIELASRVFRNNRSVDSLKDLLKIIGKSEKEKVISGEVDLILVEKQLSITNAIFLVKTGRVGEAEAYLLARREKLDGDDYGSLLPLAKSMEKNGMALCASAIYRALLDSILRRVISKIYPHGVRYLKKLDALAAAISDWKGVEPHSSYLENLRKVHARKYSFWSKY
jgi:hypothetical protein